MFTEKQVAQIYECPISRVTPFFAALVAAAAEFQINTPARLAMWLAQVGHESGRLQYREEIASGDAYNGRKDLGNTTPDAFRWAGTQRMLPGPYFKGHGLIEITGFFNHQKCGMALHPEDPAIFLRTPRALDEPADAARSAGWFWQSHGLNEVADAGDFAGTTYAINGGYNGQNYRLALWANAKRVLGITAAPCAPVVIDQPPAKSGPAAYITEETEAAARRALHMEDLDGPANP